MRGEIFKTIPPFRLTKAHADGSYTVYFGPKAPEGKVDNWVQTIASKSYFVFLRFYGLDSWFEMTWKAGDFEKLD